MGKNIIAQRRGRGTLTYRAHSHRYLADVKHRPLDEAEKLRKVQGTVQDIVHCPGHSAPLAKVCYDNNEINYIFAPEAIKQNDTVYAGEQAPVSAGNTLPLKKIPEGTIIHNIESVPGDGGKFCRAAGTSAKVLSITPTKVTIELPSKKPKLLDPECRATIGRIAGAGRTDKPIVKAGKAHHIHRARGKLYPRTSGVAMNAVDHPYGSGRGRKHSKKKVMSRNTPPGRKVGPVAAARTGRRR